MYTYFCMSLQHTTTHCSTLQHIETHCSTRALAPTPAHAHAHAHLHTRFCSCWYSLACCPNLLPSIAPAASTHHSCRKRRAAGTLMVCYEASLPIAIEPPKNRELPIQVTCKCHGVRGTWIGSSPALKPGLGVKTAYYGKRHEFEKTLANSENGREARQKRRIGGRTRRRGDGGWAARGAKPSG